MNTAAFETSNPLTTDLVVTSQGVATLVRAKAHVDSKQAMIHLNEIGCVTLPLLREAWYLAFHEHRKDVSATQQQISD